MNKVLNFGLVRLSGISPALFRSNRTPNRPFKTQPGPRRRAHRASRSKWVDAKKAKVGDEVIARTTDDFLSDKNECSRPEDLKIVGHVAEVAPHQGNSPSRGDLPSTKWS